MAQTIGQQLKQARQERNLSIEQVVESTRVRAHYIKAIEADELDLLPSPVQARAFLRLYAEFLELSLDDLIARQLAGDGEVPAILPQPQPAPIDEPTVSPAEPVSTPAEAEKVPAVGRFQHFQSTMKGFFAWARQIYSRPKKPLSLEKSEETEISPLEPPEVPAEPVEPVPVESVKKAPSPSQFIFSAIGESLRQRREMLSLTFEEIERHTHVRTHYLQALESGDFDHLPSSVQGRGMLNNYARFLDMDVDSLLLQFAEGLQALRLERQPQPVEGTEDPASGPHSRLKLPPVLRRYLSMDILVGGGLILLLLAFAIWGTSRIIGLRSDSTPQPTAPSISDVLGITPVGTAEMPTPAIDENSGIILPATVETMAITMVANGPGVVHVVVGALQSAWVRVVVDQKTEFDGRITPGMAYPFDGESQIEVLTGNGAAVSILYNGSDLGVMGALGEVVDHIYTADSILNPTATFTPSPTITPKPSLTPRPSATLRPSSTPRRSPTPTK